MVIANDYSVKNNSGTITKKEEEKQEEEEEEEEEKEQLLQMNIPDRSQHQFLHDDYYDSNRNWKKNRYWFSLLFLLFTFKVGAY